jgi:hypothetical protein
LLKSFISLGIIIFERLSGETEHNLVHAIYQCALDKSLMAFDDIPLCETLQDACSMIQTNDKLEVLNDVLIGRVRSYYLCSLCQDTFIYPSSPIDQILIFKSSADQFLAHSILPDVDDENDSTEQYSTCCNPSAINNNMQVYKQLFIKCPSCLMVSLSKI